MLLNYDIHRMRQLLESFYALSHIRIVIFDDQLRMIASYPDTDCPFCSMLRANPATGERCLTSDQYACRQCKNTGRIYEYTCHAGLTEVVTPIRCGNIIPGYIMFGQVLTQTPTEDHWAVIRAHCGESGVSLAALKDAYFQIQPHTMAELAASTRILEACAGYLYLQRYISLKEDSLPSQLDEYISSNLQADLSVNALCSHFGIGRTKLYQIFNEYYHTGVEAVTRSLRVEAAKKLLLETDLPVSEVAARVGYGDYNYFIKVFKKETQCTPSRYRKLRQAEPFLAVGTQAFCP